MYFKSAAFFHTGLFHLLIRGRLLSQKMFLVFDKNFGRIQKASVTSKSQIIPYEPSITSPSSHLGLSAYIKYQPSQPLLRQKCPALSVSVFKENWCFVQMEKLKDAFQEHCIQERAFALFYNTVGAIWVTSIHTDCCYYCNPLGSSMNLCLQS